MKFLLAGYFGYGNFGDEAILKYALDILKYYYKDAQISVLTNSPYYTKKNLEVDGIFRFNMKAVIKEIKSSDILIFPGGSIFQDITSLKSILYYLFLILTGLFFKKKVVLISQGIGPINRKIIQNLTFKILRKVNLITVRDEKSYDLLIQNGVNAKLTADLVWAFTQKMDNEKQEKSIVYGDIACHTEKGKVGIQLRNWNNLTNEKLEILAKAIFKNFPMLEYNYKLICLQKNADEQILIELGKIMHELNNEANIELCVKSDIEENVELLQSMDYMIAMRFHAGLCTINAEKPLLMISYDPKTEELCNELGMQYIDVNNFTQETVIENIKWLKEFNPTKTALKTNILAKKSQQNVDYLIKEIEK